MTSLLLPGMDGTGELFASLTRQLEPALNARVVSYPVDIPLAYEELLQRIEVPSEPFSIRTDIEFRTLDAPHLVLQRRPREAAALISEFLQ
jgi:hypothetical protein